MKLRQPLDFYAVTDHGFFMGMMPAWADPETKAGKHPAVKVLHNVNRKENLTPESSPERLYFFRELIRSGAFAELGSILSQLRAYLTNNNSIAIDVFDYDTHKSAWFDVASAAENIMNLENLLHLLVMNIPHQQAEWVIFIEMLSSVRQKFLSDHFPELILLIQRIYGIQWINGVIRVLTQ